MTSSQCNLSLDIKAFLEEFLNLYYTGEVLPGDDRYFISDAYIFDSLRTTQSFDKLGKTIIQVDDFNYRSLAPNVFETCLNLCVQKVFSSDESSAMTAQATAVVIIKNDSLKITSLHVSVPTELLDYLDFMPLTKDFHDLAKIKSEFDRRTRQLEQELMVDPLTGILHRGAAKKQIDEFLQQNGKNYAFMLFDLDHFKQVNDTFGHIAGDDILIHFSRLLQNNFRSNDVIARLGGDEFIVFMRNAPLEIIEKRAARICELVQNIVEEPYNIISVSIGIALPPQNASLEFEELYSRADKALYAVKNSGRNAYHFYA